MSLIFMSIAGRPEEKTPSTGIDSNGDLLSVRGPSGGRSRRAQCSTDPAYFLRPGGKVDVVPLEPERPQHEEREIEKGEDLLVELVRAKEQVSVVLREARTRSRREASRTARQRYNRA